MGLLSWLNRRGNELSGTSVTDRGFARANRVMADGATTGARLVGIEQQLNDGTTKRYLAIASGGRVHGVELGHGPAAVLARLRLGAEVRVRTDGDKLVLDAPEIAQKLRRRPPAEGVTDKAVDWGDQRRLKKWAPRRATIVSVQRRGATLSFDIGLTLDDGSPATAANAEIPFYAAWFAAPGAEVPVAVDGACAVVDWAAAANEPGREPGGLDDPPPAGSAAAS
jgi:hypothetical protein